MLNMEPVPADCLCLEYVSVKLETINRERLLRYDLDLNVLMQSLVKYVYIYRKNPLELENKFWDLDEAKRQEIGNALCNLYWNGHPKYQEGFIEHLQRLMELNANHYAEKGLDLAGLERNYMRSEHEMYHFLFTVAEFKCLTAMVIQKVWDVLNFGVNGSLPGLKCFCRSYINKLEKLGNHEELEMWQKTLFIPMSIKEWMNVW